jgi:hypothetical protein
MASDWDDVTAAAAAAAPAAAAAAAHGGDGDGGDDDASRSPLRVRSTDDASPTPTADQSAATHVPRHDDAPAATNVRGTSLLSALIYFKITTDDQNKKKRRRRTIG